MRLDAFAASMDTAAERTEPAGPTCGACAAVINGPPAGAERGVPGESVALDSILDMVTCSLGFDTAWTRWVTKATRKFPSEYSSCRRAAHELANRSWQLDLVHTHDLRICIFVSQYRPRIQVVFQGRLAQGIEVHTSGRIARKRQPSALIAQ